MPTATAVPTWTERREAMSREHQQTRHITLPPITAVAVLAAGVALHYAPAALTWMVWAGALVLIVTGYDHAARLDGRTERAWALGCVTALAGGGAYWTWVGPTWGRQDVVALTVCGVALAVLGTYWTKHNRVRKGVEVSRRIVAFAQDLDATGWKGIELPLNSVTVTGPDHWEARLEPVRDGEWTLEKLQQSLPRVAARLGVSVSKVQVVAATRRRGMPFRARLLVDESERAAAPVIYTVPAEATDIRDGYRKGELAGGGVFTSRWWSKGYGAVSGACTGSLGSGKTVGAQADAAALATAANALDPWIYDGKPNSPNWAPWGPRDDGLPSLTDWYTTNPQTFRLMVVACWAIAETRSASKHNPTAAEPFVGIIADECAIVFSPASMTAEVATGKSRRDAAALSDAVLDATQRYLQVHRSTATALRMLTVRGNIESFGNGTIRSYLQSGEVAVYRTANPRDAQFLFGGHGDPPIHTLPRDEPGNGYFLNVDHPEPIRARVDWFDDDEVTGEHPDNAIEALRRWKAEHPESSPTLGPDVLASIRRKVGSAYDRRHDEHDAVTGAASAWPQCEGDGCRARITGADLLIGACAECGTELSQFQAQIVGSMVEDHAAQDEAEDAAREAAAAEPAAPEPTPESETAGGAPPRRFTSHEESRAAVLAALVELGGWRSSQEVADHMGKARETVRNRLVELDGEGRVQRSGRNRATRWAAVEKGTEQ